MTNTVNKARLSSGTAVVGLFAFMALFAQASDAENMSSSVENSPLGNEENCNNYTGLPVQWGKNKHSGMVHLVGGKFHFGTGLGYAEERPEVTSRVKGFWIDQTEVTNAQFASFVQATGYVTEAEKEGGAIVFHQPSDIELKQRDYAWWHYVKGASWKQPDGPGTRSDANKPVTLVTLTDAQAYAHWLGRELPTEQQWEFAGKAGRSGQTIEMEPRDANGKPTANFWQGDFPSHDSAEDGHVGLAPVGCYKANEFKLYDMRGNAWEQTKDPYTESHRSGNPVLKVAFSPLPSRAMVIKGGSHLCGRNFCVRYRASAREAHEANLPASHIGFRTVITDN